jgi:hypothetical protein
VRTIINFLIQIGVFILMLIGIIILFIVAFLLDTWSLFVWLIRGKKAREEFLNRYDIDHPSVD